MTAMTTLWSVCGTSVQFMAKPNNAIDRKGKCKGCSTKMQPQKTVIENTNGKKCQTMRKQIANAKKCNSSRKNTKTANTRVTRGKTPKVQNKCKTNATVPGKLPKLQKLESLGEKHQKCKTNAKKKCKTNAKNAKNAKTRGKTAKMQKLESLEETHQKNVKTRGKNQGTGVVTDPW